MEVPTNRMISQGLSMPHSPRWHLDRLWVLESGAGSLSVVDEATGRLNHVALLPGFTRGLDFVGPFAFVGLSQVRESAVFSGLPITDRIPVEQRACGMWVVDVRNGQTVAFLRFESGVQEVFAVQVLPGISYPEILTEEADQELKLLPDAFVLPDAAMADVQPGAAPKRAPPSAPANPQRGLISTRQRRVMLASEALAMQMPDWLSPRPPSRPAAQPRTGWTRRTAQAGCRYS